LLGPLELLWERIVSAGAGVGEREDEPLKGLIKQKSDRFGDRPIGFGPCNGNGGSTYRGC